MAKLNLENIFTYHPPFGDQPQRYVAIREFAKAFATMATQSTPPSREQSLGLTAIQEAVMWFNSAIAINEVNLAAVLPLAEPVVEIGSAAPEAAV